MENTLKKHLTELAGIVPQWFAVLIGATYASGFLCVFTFLNHFGIYETGEDFFRVKYIHVGILFLLFPISILLPLLLSVSIKKITPIEDILTENNSGDKKPAGEAHQEHSQEMHKHHKWEKRIAVSSILIFMNMCGVFYLFTLFTPLNYVLERVYVLPLIFIVSFLGPLLTDNFVKRNIVPEKTETFAKVMRWILVVGVIAALDYLAFRGFFHQLRDIFWGSGWIPDGAIYYIVFVMLIPYTLWRTNERCKKIPHPRAKTEMRLAAVCLIGMFYFLSIIAFALTVYPQIPFAKGGGSYAESRCLTINFRPVPGVVPIVDAVTPLEKELSTSNNFVIIEITPAYLFLARKSDAGGPIAWQKMRTMPNIVEVRQDSIGEIVYGKTDAMSSN